MVTNFKRQLWMSALIIVGSIVAATIAFYFLTNDISMKANKISSGRGLIDKQTGVLEVVADLKRQVPQAAVYQTAMDTLLPTQDGLIGFGDWLNQAAAANDVSVNFSFGDTIVPATNGTFGKADFSFTATGAASALSSFLTDIEKNDPGFFVTISSFDMVATNGSYQLNGQGTTFFQQ